MKTNELNTYFKYITSKFSNDLYVVEYGYEDFTKSTETLKPRVQRDFLIHYVIEGKGTFVLDKKTYSISSNQLFFIPPGHIMQYYPNKKSPWKYFWIAFNGIKASHVCKQAKLTVENPVYTFSDMTKNKKLFQELLNLEGNSFSFDFYALSIVYRLLGLLIDERYEQLQSISSIKESYILQTIDYIEKNYTNPFLRVEEIANAIHISHVYLCKIFQSAMGTTIIKFLINYRLQKASDLLVNEPAPIKIIAEKVGFHDQTHFSKAFKEKFGIAPSFFKPMGKI